MEDALLEAAGPERNGPGMLLGWRDPVEGLFEIHRRDGDGIILLNLLDDLEYRTYSNVD